jgi:SPP1 family predicted phage head-tail adaptor
MTGVFDPSKADMQITLQRISNGFSTRGDNIETWSTYKQCYAERVRRPGGESIQTNQQVESIFSQYKVRFDQSITATMRLYEGSNTGSPAYFYIRNVEHWKREGYTLITAEKRDNT